MKKLLIALSLLAACTTFTPSWAMEKNILSPEEQLQQQQRQEKLNKQLLQAVDERKPVEAIKELIQQGADVDACDDHKDTALHMTASALNRFNCYEQDKTWKLEIIKLLLHSGANPNVVNKFHATPLLLISKAATYNSDIARLLLNYGADPNIKNDDGVTPLRWAAYDAIQDAVKILTPYGADPRITTISGKTALSDDIREWTRKFISAMLPFYESTNKPELIISANTEAIKRCYFLILAFTADVANLTNLFKLLQKQNKLQFFSSLEIKHEAINHEYDFRREISKCAVEAPGILMKYIQQGFYDKKIIAKYYTDPKIQQEQPVICARILKALQKAEEYQQSLLKKLHAGTYADVTIHTNL